MARFPVVALLLASLAFSRGASAQAVAEPPAPRTHPPFTQSGAWPIVGIHLGVPSGVSVASGVAYGLGPHVPGSLFADGELGLTSVRYGAGYLLFDDQAAGMGAAVRVAQLRPWWTAMGARRGLAYSGVEGTLLDFMVSLRLGRYVAHDRGTLVHLTTVDVGIGF